MMQAAAWPTHFACSFAFFLLPFALMLRELGYLYSGELAPVSGVYKGRHRCGRRCCWVVLSALRPLPVCVDCGEIRFYLMCIAPGDEVPEAFAAR
jgi:hypothetical protein